MSLHKKKIAETKTLLLTAKQATEVLGYGTERRFLNAVKRGQMPKAFDKNGRPYLWSRKEIEARLPEPANDNRKESETIKIDRRLGLI